MALKAGQAKPKERNMNKKDGLSKMTNRLFFRALCQVVLLAIKSIGEKVIL